MPTPLPIPRGNQVSARTMQEMVRRINALTPDEPNQQQVSARWCRFATDSEVTTAAAAGKIPSGETDNDLKIRNVQKCDGTIVAADCVSRWGVWQDVDWCDKTRVDQDAVLDLIHFPHVTEGAAPPSSPGGVVDPTVPPECGQPDPRTEEEQEPTDVAGVVEELTNAVAFWNRLSGRWESDACLCVAESQGAGGNNLHLAKIKNTATGCCLLDGVIRQDEAPKVTSGRSLETCECGEEEFCPQVASLTDAWFIRPACDTPDCALVTQAEECVDCNDLGERNLYRVVAPAPCGCCPTEDDAVTAKLRYWCDGQWLTKEVCMCPYVLAEGYNPPGQPEAPVSGVTWQDKESGQFQNLYNEASNMCPLGLLGLSGGRVWAGKFELASTAPVIGVYVEDNAGKHAIYATGTGCDDCYVASGTTVWHEENGEMVPGAEPGFDPTMINASTAACTLIFQWENGHLSAECTMEYVLVFWCCLDATGAPEETNMRIFHVEPGSVTDPPNGNDIHFISYGDAQNQVSNPPCLNVACMDFDNNFGRNAGDCEVTIPEVGAPMAVTVNIPRHPVHLFGGLCTTCLWTICFGQGADRDVEIFVNGASIGVFQLDNPVSPGNPFSAAEALCDAIELLGFECTAKDFLGGSSACAYVTASGQPDVVAVFYDMGVEAETRRMYRAVLDDTDDSCAPAAPAPGVPLDFCKINACFSW